MGSGEIDIGVKDSGERDINEQAMDSSGWETGLLTWTSIGELVDLTKTGFCWLLLSKLAHGWLMMPSRLILSLVEIVMQCLMRSLTSSLRRNEGLKRTWARLIWLSVSNGISPQTMS